MLKKIEDGRDLRRAAQGRLRHFLADFMRLEQEYPGIYPRVIVRGEGPYVFDDTGRRLLDAGNHLGACNIGHGRKEVARRMADQAERLEFSALDSGNSHDAAIRYAERLSGVLPMDDACISFCGSGSEGNELAIKIARSHFALKGEPQRTKILSRVGSYHGSSYGAMAATGIDAFSAGFGPMAPGFARIPQPSHDRCIYCGNSEACTLACVEATEQLVSEEGARDDRRDHWRAGGDPSSRQGSASRILATHGRALPPDRRTPHRRRGRHRFRPDRAHVRLRALGHSARHHGDGEGHLVGLRADGCGRGHRLG